MNVIETTCNGVPAGVVPLLLGAEDAARALGIGRTSFLLADKTGEISLQSVRIGGQRLWSLPELRAWVLAGCPARQRWADLWREQRDTAP